MNQKDTHPRRRARIRTLRKENTNSPSKNPSKKRPRRSQSRFTPRPPRKQKSRDRRDAASERNNKKKVTIPSPGENLRIVPLGGVEEIGKNMTAIEYKDDIIIVDAGFQFSEAETPGVDYIIPDVTYLEERKDKIRAIFITHGHYDHIGAIPYVMSRIGNPPIYSRAFGAAIIKKRQTEFPDAPELKMHVVEGDETIKAGEHFKVQFFTITHAIPDSMGLIIGTPIGDIAFIEDIRIDHKDGEPTKEEQDHWKYFKDRDILLMTLDSTSIEKPGFSLPEREAIENVEEIIKTVPGRLIIGTFASQVERVMQFIKIADKYNKKVVIDGRSMKTNVEIVKELKLMKLTNLIPIDEMESYPPDKIVVIATGAQGEQYSVFDRIANKNHKYIRLTTRDTVLFSSSIIPGNDRSVEKLKDNLYRQEARIITYVDADVHSSGHGSRGELAWIHQQVNYRFFVPLHGHHYRLRIHAEVAEGLGTPKKNIVIPDDGSIIEITPDGEHISILKERAPSDAVMVDGFSISGQQEVVIRDRQVLAEDGIVVIVASIDPRGGKLRKSPDIIARGFVYVRESQQLFDETRAIVKRTVENTVKGMRPINFDVVKATVTDEVRKHLFQRTAKSPMVIPVIIGV